MVVYLDNAATSFPKPESVYQALDAFARRDLANPGRAGHKMALAAEHALDEGRHLLNQFFRGLLWNTAIPCFVDGGVKADS